MTDNGEITATELRAKILDLVAQYHDLANTKSPFEPGRTPVPVSGRVYGAEEMAMLVDSALDFWLTTGRFNDAFEQRLGQQFGLKYALTVNSGSSANLVALAALTSPLMRDRALKPGDEVITCATGFPTTVNPVLQYGLVPVFVDVDIPTYNIDIEAMEAAISTRTRAIVLAHTLGNPFNLKSVMDLAQRHGLWVIEDCCDALGATYDGHHVGTFGDVATLSFYPAHHITTGEGGAVLTSNPILRRAMESFRDWGRDCFCPPGKDNTCGKRFERTHGDLPHGYDHKYVYSHVGYNLKITDMQAAVGLAQIDRLPGFIADRRRNFALLSEGLADLEDQLILPQATAGSDPSWFGFPLTLRDASLDRQKLMVALNEAKVGTRMLFGGNLVRQPYMKDRPYRVAGPLTNSDIVTERTFWLGLFPGLETEAITYMLETLRKLLRN